MQLRSQGKRFSDTLFSTPFIFNKFSFARIFLLCVRALSEKVWPQQRHTNTWKALSCLLVMSHILNKIRARVGECWRAALKQTALGGSRPHSEHDAAHHKCMRCPETFFTPLWNIVSAISGDSFEHLRLSDWSQLFISASTNTLEALAVINDYLHTHNAVWC